MFSMVDFLNNRQQPAIMGIVNASGDSFSEKEFSSAETALSRALQLLDDGADILDLGGESTRPGAEEITPEEEISRILPVLKKLKKIRPDSVCSVDTRHAMTARAVLDSGAEIINDVSMLRHDPEMAAVTAEYQAGLILVHSRNVPKRMMDDIYCSYPSGVAATAAAEISAAEKKAVAAGIKKENILFDPGFGFAKNAEQCWELIKELEMFSLPSKIVAGISRKSFLGELTGEKDPAARGSETLALELYLASCNVAMIRTHAVRELYRGLLVRKKLQEILQK